MPLPKISDAIIYQTIAQKQPIAFKELAWELRDKMCEMSVRRKVESLHKKNLITRPTRNGMWSVAE